MHNFKKITIIFIAMALIVTLMPAAAFADSEDIGLQGKAACIYIGTTDEYIYSMNSRESNNLASITKLLTCLIAVEELGADTVVTVDPKAEDVLKSGVAVRGGEEITVEDLMYEALLISANDAAVALAIATAGSEEDFAKLMNKRVKSIGCTNTHFINASGVHVADQYSCARDVALIAQEALSNKEVRKVAGASKHTVPKTNMRESMDLVNYNYFLDGGTVKFPSGSSMEVKAYPGVFGGKTGTTSDAKTTMVVGCEIDGLEVYCVIMDSTLSERYNDMLKLLKYASKNINSYKAFSSGDVLGQVSLKGGAVNKVDAVVKMDGYINLPEGASASLVTVQIVPEEDLRAPIAEGQVVGKAQIYLADEIKRTVNIRASEEVKEGWFLSGLGITNLQTVIILGVLLLILSLFLVILRLRAINRKKAQERRRQKALALARKQMEQEEDWNQRGWTRY